MMKDLRQMLLVVAMMGIAAAGVFGQKDKPRPPKEDPPKVVVKEKDNKPTPPPSPPPKKNP